MFASKNYARLGELQPAKSANGTITSVAIDTRSGCVVAIGLDGEALDVNLGQVQEIPAGSAEPEIGKPLAGVDILRNAISGQPV